MIRRFLILTALVFIPTVGSVTQAQAEEYCREYTKTVSINGRSERAYGTACRQNDGSWEIAFLEGGERAQDKVRDAMYDDIEKYETRHSNRNRTVERIIVVDNYAYDRPYYRDRYNRYDARYRHNSRYHKASYNHWPFVIQWNVNGGGNYKSHNRHAKKHYKRDQGYKHHRGRR